MPNTRYEAVTTSQMVERLLADPREAATIYRALELLDAASRGADVQDSARAIYGGLRYRTGETQ